MNKAPISVPPSRNQNSEQSLLTELADIKSSPGKVEDTSRFLKEISLAEKRAGRTLLSRSVQTLLGEWMGQRIFEKYCAYFD